MSQVVTAQEAKQFNFVNDILPGFENESEWPDLSKIPTIGQLLNTDQRTLENALSLINAARDNDRLDAAIYRELKKCVDNNMDPDFVPKMKMYMAKTLGKKKNQQPKL